MCKRFRIATEHDIHMTKVTVHPNTLRGDNQEIRGRRALLFGTVFGIRTNVNHLFQSAELVQLCISG